jgi:hypothetical protein
MPITLEGIVLWRCYKGCAILYFFDPMGAPLGAYPLCRSAAEATNAAHAANTAHVAQDGWWLTSAGLVLKSLPVEWIWPAVRQESATFV